MGIEQVRDAIKAVEAAKTPAFGEVGFESYILTVEYPYSWATGYTLHYQSEAELEEAVASYKARSARRGHEGYIALEVGIVTRVN